MLTAIALLVQTLAAAAAPVGETTADVFPPPNTEVDRGLFPDRTVVGFPHVTRTGAEAGAFATAPADQFPLVQQPFGPVVLSRPNGGKAPKRPKKGKGKGEGKFEPIYSWGFLTPRHSLDPCTWGACDASPIVPEQCTLSSVHTLMRHGARYPTSGDAAELFATRLLNASTAGEFEASGNLAFLNDWTYKLGSDILVPFGRLQCMELGVRNRVAYGQLLNDFTEKGTLPVFRTGSIDRMVETMEAFGQGFFGRDSDKQFSMTIAIENKGVNATVYPGGGTCPNSALDVDASKLGMAEFVNRAMAGTAARLQAHVKGYTITPTDVQTMLSLCAYETLSLGYSAFCPLFTEEDFRNMAYAYDIMFYYGNGFGGQTTAAQGKGWVQEFLARLTHTPIEVYDSSTNSTLDGNPETFPLNQSIYADASHDSYIMSTFVALNLTALNSFGRLPTNVDRGHNERPFYSSKIVPFNTNFVAQVMRCDGREEEQIRFILNDAVIPLHETYAGCQGDEDGLCPLQNVVAALQTRVAEIDYHKARTNLQYY
ncbi:hypothetical protein CspeluHIS016_0101700 [Cutaneotrichosporon spelunceum]|uniref:Phosphoglycerate mutase-like protein n=1 Tax=Cutaneotrichosporon spelunceum TaxID=1672016 RepID=A0AAD3TN80_9TREE|nr:hypothetical protein CspeluHIS016_0101700 [Cutaneotrichosporon spelunceum]